jgi:hypothetical protein
MLDHRGLAHLFFLRKIGEISHAIGNDEFMKRIFNNSEKNIRHFVRKNGNVDLRMSHGAPVE